MCRSYNNQNLRILYGLPYNAHNWIVEELSGGKHARQQMMARYIKFVSSLYNHKSLAVSCLFEKTRRNAQSLVGANLRTIHLETNEAVIPGLTKPHVLSNHRVYDFNEREMWKIKLLVSLLEIRDQRWEILFDEEEEDQFSTEDIIMMIKDVSTS